MQEVSSMKIITMIRHALGFATVVVATLAVGATAEARTIAGTAGQPGPDAQSACFEPLSTGVIQSTGASGCNATPQFCVQLVVDNGDAYYDIALQVLQNSANQIGCFATGVFNDGVIAAQSSKVFASENGTSTIEFNDFPVVDSGALFVCCDMTAGTQIQTVNWNS